VSYYLERVQRAVDYVETKLDEDVALSDVAKAAGVSQWHFQRMFKALTGETLKTYIRSRRLAASLERLLTTDLRVLDIALTAGFESQEAFARAFKQAFGLTPQQYRGMRDKSLFFRQEKADSERLEYHAAIEVTSVGALPEGLVSVEVPAGHYARFEHRGPASRIDHTVSYAYASWLSQSGRRHTYAPDLEIYGERYHPTSDDSVMHYAIPITEARQDPP
jgi:AraC-like DNA-binding protein